MSVANKHQQEAIDHVKGPLLIIAGPGSGKTYTLVERIINLIQNHGVEPEALFVVTFTEKAAQELTTRISNRLLELRVEFNLNEMFLGTFHSICLRIIEDYREYTRLKRSFVLMDQFDQQYFLYQNLNDFRAISNVDQILGSDKTPVWSKSESLLQWINKVTEEAIDHQRLIESDDTALIALGECYALYLLKLEERNALDFSTIQLEALNLLRNHPVVLASLKSRIKYLMVDEYQDTNTIQEMILKLLMGDDHNLCVVGDDDQALYRFRGATIRNILQFPDNFDDNECKQIGLVTNYRSHPDIIHFYNRWMSDQVWEVNDQRYRYTKHIKPREEEFESGPTVIKAISEVGDEWVEEVYALLVSLRTDGKLTDWNQVAFLFKSVKSDKVKALAQGLEERGIAVYSPRANLFFEREEIRLMIGAIMLVFPQFRSIRAPKEGVELAIWGYYDQHCLKPFMAEVAKPGHKDLLDWCQAYARRHLGLTKNADYAFSGLFYQLLQFPLFADYLDAETGSGRAQRNLATMSQLLAKFEYLHHISVLNPKYLESNLRGLFNQFLKFLKDGGIDEYEDASEYAPSGHVSFLTIHQSKGLEFPVVMVGSLGASPRKQYKDLDEVLEQGYLNRESFEPLESTKYFDFWRLYYTAFSRAQNLLVLTDQERLGSGRTPSKHFVKYVDDLPSWRDRKDAINELNFDTVKDVNIKKEYAFTSHITLFETCAEQYRFFKDLEFQPIKASPMLFGTLVHETLEDIHKAALRSEEHLITRENIEGWFQDNYRNLANRERVYLADSTLVAALKHVMRYVNRKQDDWSGIKDCEVDISLVKGNYILKGSVDLIVGENNTVEIVDFKSEKKPDMEKDAERIKHHKRQLEVYAHLVEERTGHKVSKMHLYFTGVESGVPTITFDKDGSAIGSTIKVFDNIVDRIEMKDFSITERPVKTCVDCDMKSYCDRKNWKFKEAV
ncbi:DNA helicase-2/ATP-dependent DNA helicase PcrA [Zhongshania antarctica]|uniref:DNA 3'-5' helicase n=1 Tax=Zhongshania antarctica TaxID=641702 RepID=A0A840R6Z1_9GAMM|nr:ATP-dependent DNA helicase [Zhongshania antarctica]MBB5188298.1 DNA helicase-2/ATP-dependent DNA helicase PcrA [Zhongshania antarctica]